MVPLRNGRTMNMTRTDKGFTLLEVLVAVVILGLSYVAILQSFSLSLRNITKIEKQRANMFEELSNLIHDARFSDDTEDMEVEGEDFIEGHKYRLVLVPSESGDMETLRLEKI